jgi:pimeloyl-ACP methyl ester carboxylesterase
MSRPFRSPRQTALSTVPPRFRRLSLAASVLAICICSVALPISVGSQVSHDSSYTRRSHNDSVIVFVHGILGDPHTTWTNANTKAYWPDLMKDDPSFNKFDIYVVRYPSSFMTADYTVDQLVEVLRREFDDGGVFASHKRVYFLCHSMGGLVVRAYLERYREKASQVPFIYFFSTPTTGAQLAAIARLISDNRQFDALQPIQANEYLSSIQSTWLAARFPIASYCAYETQQTDGVLVVGQESATNLCNRRLDPINADHFQIVKPTDSEDQPYKAFRTALEENLRESRTNHAVMKVPPLPPVVKSKYFVIVVPFTKTEDGAEIPFDANDVDPLGTTYRDLASVATFPYSPFPTDNSPPVTGELPLDKNQVLTYLGHVLQYDLLMSINQLQNVSMSETFDSRYGTTVHANAPVAVPEASVYPFDELLKLFNRLDLKFNSGTGGNDPLWKAYKMKVPSGVHIDLFEIKAPRQPEFSIRLERIPDLKLDFELTPAYVNTGRSAFPKNFVPDSPRRIEVAFGYAFAVEMTLTWSGNRTIADDYVQWFNGLGEGLQKKYQVQ